MKEPFVDLRAMHEEVRPEIEAAFKDVFDRSSFIAYVWASLVVAIA